MTRQAGKGEKAFTPPSGDEDVTAEGSTRSAQIVYAVLGELLSPRNSKFLADIVKRLEHGEASEDVAGDIQGRVYGGQADFGKVRDALSMVRKQYLEEPVRKRINRARSAGYEWSPYDHDGYMLAVLVEDKAKNPATGELDFKLAADQITRKGGPTLTGKQAEHLIKTWLEYVDLEEIEELFDES